MLRKNFTPDGRSTLRPEATAKEADHAKNTRMEGKEHMGSLGRLIRRCGGSQVVIDGKKEASSRAVLYTVKDRPE